MHLFNYLDISKYGKLMLLIILKVVYSTPDNSSEVTDLVDSSDSENAKELFHNNKILDLKNGSGFYKNNSIFGKENARRYERRLKYYRRAMKKYELTLSLDKDLQKLEWDYYGLYTNTKLSFNSSLLTNADIVVYENLRAGALTTQTKFYNLRKKLNKVTQKLTILIDSLNKPLMSEILTRKYYKYEKFVEQIKAKHDKYKERLNTLTNNINISGVEVKRKYGVYQSVRI